MSLFQKKGPLTFDRIWFKNNGESTCDIIRYLRTSSPLTSKWYIRNEPHITVISDLTLTINNILSNSTKTIKYEVSKCLKENVQLNFFGPRDIATDNSIIERFHSAYLKFVETTHNQILLKVYNREKINNYIENRILYVSEASKDDCKVFHVYVADGSNCVLIYSASNFRGDNKERRNLTGRMNKLLHIKDMESFQQRGVTKYDWGNITSTTNPNNIDKFKMFFGGDIVIVYNILVGNTFKGKLMVLAIKILHI